MSIYEKSVHIFQMILRATCVTNFKEEGQLIQKPELLKQNKPLVSDGKLDP